MNLPEKTITQDIITLHNEITSHLRQSLEKAIKLGGLLTEQKASLKHGEFTGWIKDNLTFTERTARNYMRLYREKDRLKTETVSDLKSAYALISHSGDSFQGRLADIREQFSQSLKINIEEENDLTILKELSNQARDLQNQCAELHIEIARALGNALNELEKFFGGSANDLLKIIQDEQKRKKLMHMIDNRIKELSG